MIAILAVVLGIIALEICLDVKTLKRDMKLMRHTEQSKRITYQRDGVIYTRTVSQIGDIVTHGPEHMVAKGEVYK